MSKRYRMRVYRKPDTNEPVYGTKGSWKANGERLQYKLRFEDALKKDAEYELRCEYSQFEFDKAEYQRTGIQH